MADCIIFKSKPGFSIVIPLVLVLGTVGTLFVIAKFWVGLLIILFAAGFITHMFITTRYTIHRDQLNITCGFFFNQTIEIATITRISETKTTLSAPATSLNRLQLFYNTFDSVTISPTNKSAFIAELAKINRNITIQLKTAK